MNKQAKTLLLRVLVALVALLALIFISTHSVVIVNTKNAGELSLSTDPKITSFSEVKEGRHIRVVRSGTWFAGLKSNTEFSGVSFNAKPFLIPSSVSIENYPQANGYSVATTGARCILYDNPTSSVTITSSCDDRNELKIIRNGTRSQQIFSDGVRNTYPASGGFYYIKSSTESSYSLGYFDASTGGSRVLSRFSSSEKPVGVTDSASGYLKGVIADDGLLLSSSGFKRKYRPKNLPKPEGGAVVVASYRAGEIYVYKGNTPDINEGESEIEKSIDQQLVVFDKNQQEKARYEIADRYLFRELAVSDEGVPALLGEDGEKTSLCTVNEELGCDSIWEKDDFSTSLIAVGKNFSYISQGKLWLYNPNSLASSLLYGGDLSELAAVKVGDYIFTASRTGDSLGDIRNFRIDPSIAAENAVKLETQLPLAIEEGPPLTIDSYRRNILVYDPLARYDKSTAINRTKSTLRDELIPFDDYSFVYTTAPTYKTSSPIKLAPYTPVFE